MFLIMSTAPNSRWPCPHRQHWCSTSSIGVWLRSIHWRRRDHEGPCHSRGPVLFCSSAPNQEHAVCTSTSGLRDIGACLDCHQAEPLQLVSRRNVHATSWSVAVSSKCRRPHDFYSQKDQPHLSIAQGPPLSVKFKLCVLVYRCLHGTAPPYLTDDLSLTPADGNCRHLRSADLQLWWLGLPDAWLSATVHFPWQLHVLGTVFQQPSGTHHHFCHSGAAWIHGFSSWLCNTNFTRLHCISFSCFYH